MYPIHFGAHKACVKYPFVVNLGECMTYDKERRCMYDNRTRYYSLQYQKLRLKVGGVRDDSGFIYPSFGTLFLLYVFTPNFM